MRITYANKVLAGGGAESPAGFAFNGSPVVQFAEFVRATDIAIYDRLRKANSISFSVTRQHDNLAAAEYFAATHSDDLPNKGALLVMFEGNSGSATGGRSFAQATVSASTQQVGVTTITTYAVTCGKGRSVT